MALPRSNKRLVTWCLCPRKNMPLLKLRELGVFPWLPRSIYEESLRLFCFVLFCSCEIHRTGMLLIVFLVSLESSGRGGLHGLWFHGVWTCGAKALEYWMISSLKIKINHCWKIRRNWNVPLMLLERSWWAGFNEIYLISFGFRLWEILIFNWFLPLKIQINSKNPGFGRNNQLRTR